MGQFEIIKGCMLKYSESAKQKHCTYVGMSTSCHKCGWNEEEFSRRRAVCKLQRDDSGVWRYMEPWQKPGSSENNT